MARTGYGLPCSQMPMLRKADSPTTGIKTSLPPNRIKPVIARKINIDATDQCRILSISRKRCRYLPDAPPVYGYAALDQMKQHDQANNAAEHQPGCRG